MGGLEKGSDLMGYRTMDQWIQRLSNLQKKKRYIPKYLKPKVLHDEASQFPFRCPLCWQKHLFRSQAEECLKKCWETFPEKLFEYMDEINSKPKEIGSWQWDIGRHRSGKYCGIGEYDCGPSKYFKSLGNGFIEITLDELISILEDANEIYLWQKGHKQLPSELENFANIPREKFKKAKTTPIHDLIKK